MPLLLAEDGRRLSKRDKDLDMGVLRTRWTPEDLTGRLALLAGLQSTPAPVTPAALMERFSWEQVPRTDIVVPGGLFE